MKLNDLSGAANAIFMLSLMMSANYLGTLFGCRIQNVLQNNMILKHFLGFLTMYFFITLINEPKNNQEPSILPHQKLYYTIFIYLAFMVSSKMHIKFWVPFLVMLGSIYTISIFKEHYANNKDSGINIQLETLDKIQHYILLAAITTLISGFLYYMGEKKIEYGKDFSYYTFIVGQPVCALKTPKINKSFSEVLAIGINPSIYEK